MLLEQVAEGVISWETIARGFLYHVGHARTISMVEDNELQPHQDCEICHDIFPVDDLSVEPHSEMVCCQSCLPQREEESRQEQLEAGELECTDCGEDTLDENGECPTCKLDPEY